MKRDVDLFRLLLLQIESATEDKEKASPWIMLSCKGYTPEELRYHARMMLEQKFLYEDACILNAGDQSGTAVVKYRPDAITHAGHEFLDSVREEKNWIRAKSIGQAVGNTGVSALWDIAKGLAQAAAASAVGLSTA